MNHALLKSVIYDQHEFIRDFQIVPRNYEFEENGNYVLVGLRGAGKSTLLYKIVLDLVASGVDWEQIVYINFEDERLSEFTAADFNDLLSVQSEMSDKKGYFFLDEVQNIDGWEKFARRMADAKEHIYITGSNAKMLSRDAGHANARSLNRQDLVDLDILEQAGPLGAHVVEQLNVALVVEEGINLKDVTGLYDAVMANTILKLLHGATPSRGNDTARLINVVR